jgi:exosome complex component RRP4
MPITILPPAPALSAERHVPYQPADDEEFYDSEGDVDMEGIARASKRRKASRQHIVTPGEIVTNDPQWMRSVIRFQFLL